MSIISDKSEEIYERYDLHILASQVQKNNFNIRKFNEKNTQKHYKHSVPTKYTQTSIKNRISTQPVEERVSSMSFTNTFQRVMNINEPDSKKRNRLTGSLKYRNQSLHKLQADKQTSQFQIHDIQFEKAKKCKELDRKNNKGPLRKKIVETWLNSILMQSTQFQVIDQSLGNAALKKFQIDQNSLLSRGIKPENISKLYQSLFVHSIGFNNGIKELVGNNNQVAKNIWKVFSILLQYCAQGKFETIIGVIEKEKIIKIQELRQEVAKRQQIIERNDELNETKNIQIFKQIRNLTQQNINLKNQKEILYQDFQKTQQAFNEEVILRLKFENKINELFGIHRQLAIKHQRLYDDYKKKMAEWTTANQKNSQLTQLNTELKVNVSDLTTQKQRLMSSEKYNKQLISTLKEDIARINAQYNMAKHQYDEQRRITKELKRRISQLEIQLRNLTQIVGLKDKSWKQTHAEYQLSLLQNNRLYSVISEQRVQVEELLFQKKQFNNKILNLMADASFQKRKKQQFSALYYETDKKVKELFERNKALQLQIKILKEKNESFQIDLKQNYENIKKMHGNNSQLQDQLYYLRRFRDSLDVVLKQKDDKSQLYRIQNQKYQNECEELKASFNKLQLTYKMLKQQYQIEVENNKQKIQRFRQQNSLFEKGEDQKNRLLSVTVLQLQKTKKYLQNTMLDYKNEKFQRFQLKAMYEQTLGMMQKKNIQQKQLGRQISQLKDNVLKVSHERDRTAYALQNQILKRQRIQEQLNVTKQKLADHIEKKSSYVHPFLHEDVAENYRIVKEKYICAEQVIRIKINQINQLNQKYTNQINNLKQTHNEYVISYKKQKQKQLYLKQSELQYEREANEGMKNRLEKLQALAQTYAKKIEQRTTSEKQKLYADMIQHKTKTIQQLMEKVNVQSSKNEKLRMQSLKKQAEFEVELISLKNNYKLEKGWLQQKIGDLNFQITHIKQEAERLKKQIIQTESNFENKLKERMELYLENFKKSQSIYDQKSEHELIGPSLTSMDGSNKQKGKQKQKQTGNDTGAKWRAKVNPQIKKRNSIAKKIKMAYDYYNH